MPNLAIHARKLLDFALQSVEEGRKNPSQALECFSEADCTIRILQKTLLKEDEFLCGQLELLFLNISLVGIAKRESQSERDHDMMDAIERIELAKTWFQA